MEPGKSPKAAGADVSEKLVWCKAKTLPATLVATLLADNFGRRSRLLPSSPTPSFVYPKLANLATTSGNLHVSPSEILGPGGHAARLPNYEHRGEQLAMAEAVDRAIRQKHHLAVEAGTGVGKGFAYLVPAIFGRGRREGVEQQQSEQASAARVVVSTIRSACKSS